MRSKYELVDDAFFTYERAFTLIEFMSVSAEVSWRPFREATPALGEIKVVNSFWWD